MRASSSLVAIIIFQKGADLYKNITHTITIILTKSFTVNTDCELVFESL